ncbi:Hsp20/alpha crystallin family protein [Empedobacter falsenii]|uniref:Hsp20/alpha crystallin family protein n=2 Tax=Weeksellaceae TaxID=2762318 RepID=A0A376G6H8_9FLAO|nr:MULTISPECIES: Hsp20/alpha crystallin family protein [Empedobacter]MDM1134983.1 Hsp20/alpha crystallin family protein [Empedobacter sp. R750]HCC95074.1 heat-shock protein Hsp20 [Flavobacteriaceae bacterium]MDH1881739.1 Hsp20/alpha crystallin family protein [Empedobacter sp. GD03797]MDM1041404.1 Hsp20/alpha crystallin family protein [Empedobacter brevis]MDM1299541.1 Hsp20/alpha crystallin family protein [Empedobacter falsenii]
MNNEIKNLNIQDMNTVRKNRANYFPFGFENAMRPKFETFVNSQNQFPAVNIKENEDSFEILLAAPGLNKEDFSIEIDENILKISSEFKQNEEVKDEKFSRREFNFSSFKRAFTLPETINEDKIEASYVNGILQLVLPKKEEALPKEKRSIQIS